MEDVPVLYQYRVGDREELFDFIRDVYPADDSARLIRQWAWRYESGPSTVADELDVTFIRIGRRIVGLSTAFRLRMWMGGIECAGEGRGGFVVHPDHRGKKLWQTVGTQDLKRSFAPVQFGWSRLPPHVGESLGRPSDPIRPLMRILDAGPLVEHLTRSQILASIGTGASKAFRVVSAPMRRDRGKVVHLNSFDDRADRMWERARRPANAMIIRDHQYLNWRYCRRPDATYSLYGIERGSELDGFLIARTTTYQDLPWGYLVDFLVPENDPRALSSLVHSALDEFRRAGVAAVSCVATDPAARSVLLRAGFFPAPQRKPIRFMRRMSQRRPELAKFMALKAWYLTMGDGDLELRP
jgi:hypothetical protein